VEERFKPSDHLVVQQDRKIEELVDQLALLHKSVAKPAIGGRPNSRTEGIQSVVGRLECEIHENSARLDCLGGRIRESDEELWRNAQITVTVVSGPLLRSNTRPATEGSD
jgi:hypothetical protein